MKNLLKESDAYYKDNHYYEIFSQAEDYENKVSDYLKEKSKDKIILDAGCGTGKFLPVLESVSSKYIGVDLSSDQLYKARQKSSLESSSFICSTLASIPIESDSIDLIISSWVLGTITDINERLTALRELKRVLKTSGKIILVENAENSEFETIRGRDKDSRTKEYNDWILRNGFTLDKTIDTFFEFKSLEEARICFDVIYGREVSSKIKSKQIEHKINTYMYL